MPHIHTKYDFVITVYIIYRNKVLLVHHPRYDKWIPMGGHIELDEDPEEALFREIKEETGLRVKILSSKPSITSPGTKFILKPNFVDVHEANPPHQHIALIYFAQAESNNAILSDEHNNIKWLSESELLDPKYNLDRAVVYYAQEALKLGKVH